MLRPKTSAAAKCLPPGINNTSSPDMSRLKSPTRLSSSTASSPCSSAHSTAQHSTAQHSTACGWAQVLVCRRGPAVTKQQLQRAPPPPHVSGRQGASKTRLPAPPAACGWQQSILGPSAAAHPPPSSRPPQQHPHAAAPHSFLLLPPLPPLPPSPASWGRPPRQPPRPAAAAGPAGKQQWPRSRGLACGGWVCMAATGAQACPP